MGGARCLDCHCWRTLSESGAVHFWHLRDYYDTDAPDGRGEWEQRREEKPGRVECREWDCPCHQSEEGARAALDRALGMGQSA